MSCRDDFEFVWQEALLNQQDLIVPAVKRDGAMMTCLAANSDVHGLEMADARAEVKSLSTRLALEPGNTFANAFENLVLAELLQIRIASKPFEVPIPEVHRFFKCVRRRLEFVS